MGIGLVSAPPAAGVDGKPSPRSLRSAQVPIFNSYPQARQTIYLHFGGTTEGGLPYSGRKIHGQDDQPLAFSEEERQDIKQICEIVAEKLSPFAVNVTTDPLRFDTAWENGINRTIVTIGASHKGASWSAVWFSRPVGGTCSIAQSSTFFGITNATGHELGHSLGMDHDNSPRVAVPGTNVTWGPMFSGGPTLTQWSKNETPRTDYARRQRDPLEIISSPTNGIGYRPDDHGNLAMTATLLPPGLTSPAGIIERNTDVDVFRFTTTGGAIELRIRPSDFRPVMLDVLAELVDIDGKRLFVADPKDDIGATLNIAELPAGTYYLRVSGTGQGTAGIDGYSDYGSLGTYHIEAKYRPKKNQANLVHDLTTIPATGQDGSSTVHVGLLQVPAEGQYTFHATANSSLEIKGTRVVDRDGADGHTSGHIYLAAGLVPIRITCDAALANLPIEYSGPGIIRKKIPTRVLYPAPKSPVAPIAADDAYSLVNNQLAISALYGVLLNDVDYNDDPLKATLVRDVRHGRLALKADGSFVYTTDGSLPAGRFDSFTYRVSDGKNISHVATAKIQVWGPRVDFRAFQLINYTGIGLSYGTRIEDDGKALRLIGSDCSKKILLPYRVTPNTVLAFDFDGVVEGQYHQIGLINNKVGVDPTKLFRVWGTCGRRGAFRFEAIGDIHDYINGAGSYVIPVGKHFIGPMQAICFGNWSEEKTNDDPGETATPQVKRVAECRFSNVRIYEASFPNYSYTSTSKAIQPVDRPSGIRVTNDISEAFARAQPVRPGSRDLLVPLHGIFSGGHDDWYLRYEIVKDLDIAGARPTKISQRNDGSYLVFSLANANQFTSMPFVLKVTDGKSEKEQAWQVSWEPQRGRLSAQFNVAEVQVNVEASPVEPVWKGLRLAFLSSRQGAAQIYVLNEKGETKKVQLTSDKSDYGPARCRNRM
jgi:VCBS repeat-containing protein